jgi:hypothetical protein
MTLLTDACCPKCKGPHGICRTRGACKHHIETRRRQDKDDLSTRLYRDPTGDQAVNNITREQRGRPRNG